MAQVIKSTEAGNISWIRYANGDQVVWGMVMTNSYNMTVYLPVEFKNTLYDLTASPNPSSYPIVTYVYPSNKAYIEVGHKIYVTGWTSTNVSVHFRCFGKWF